MGRAGTELWEAFALPRLQGFVGPNRTQFLAAGEFGFAELEVGLQVQPKLRRDAFERIAPT
jgi:hypothetical protein